MQDMDDEAEEAPGGVEFKLYKVVTLIRCSCFAGVQLNGSGCIVSSMVCRLRPIITILVIVARETVGF